MVSTASGQPQHSVARQWNELLLESIRNDYARPTVHARNLFHVSVATWDGWAVYDPEASTVLFAEDHAASGGDRNELRSEAISHACYRILRRRFGESPGVGDVLPLYDGLMDQLGYDRDNATLVGDSPAAVGNRIARAVLDFGAFDGANEFNDYEYRFYQPANEPLLPFFPDGLGEFVCEKDEFLVFEDGPSVEVRLQWASYYDASDQCSLSRIWGGIHPSADDLPGRLMGQEIGEEAFVRAAGYWGGDGCGELDAIEILGIGCPGSGGLRPLLSVDGCTEAGNLLDLRIRDASSDGSGFLLASTEPVDVWTLGDCTFYVPRESAQVQPLDLSVLPGQPGSGSLQLDLDPALYGGQPGSELILQAVLLDENSPERFTVTNAVRLRLL